MDDDTCGLAAGIPWGWGTCVVVDWAQNNTAPGGKRALPIERRTVTLSLVDWTG